MKRQNLDCYDYCKTALDEKTLSEDEMKNKLPKRKGPWTEKAKFRYARKTNNSCMWKRSYTWHIISTSGSTVLGGSTVRGSFMHKFTTLKHWNAIFSQVRGKPDFQLNVTRQLRIFFKGFSRCQSNRLDLDYLTHGKKQGKRGMLYNIFLEIYIWLVN